MKSGFSAHKISDRAVSPVIAVILMVAITVILSAVIATFVLDIGGSLSETAPQVTFEAEQGATYTVATGSNDAEVRSVSITLTGGESLEIAKLGVTVNGEQAYDIKRDVHRWGGDSEKFPFEEMGDTLSVGETIRIVHKHNSGFVDDPSVAYSNRAGYSNNDKHNPEKAELWADNNNNGKKVQLETGDTIRISYQSSDGNSQILYEYEVN